jgi:hypothetical protein
MKQILIVINIENELPQITVNTTFADDSKFIKVIKPENLTEKDLHFQLDLKALILKYKGE